MLPDPRSIAGRPKAGHCRSAPTRSTDRDTRSGSRSPPRAPIRTTTRRHRARLASSRCRVSMQRYPGGPRVFNDPEECDIEESRYRESCELLADTDEASSDSCSTRLDSAAIPVSFHHRGYRARHWRAASGANRFAPVLLADFRLRRFAQSAGKPRDKPARMGQRRSAPRMSACWNPCRALPPGGRSPARARPATPSSGPLRIR